MQTCVGSFFYIPHRITIRHLRNRGAHYSFAQQTPPYPTHRLSPAPCFSLNIRVTKTFGPDHIALQKKNDEFFIKKTRSLLLRN